MPALSGLLGAVLRRLHVPPLSVLSLGPVNRPYRPRLLPPGLLPREERGDKDVEGDDEELEMLRAK